VSPAVLAGVDPTLVSDWLRGEQLLAERGLALFARFPVTQAQRVLLPELETTLSCPLAVLVANDARLWPPVAAELVRSKSVHPLDSYVERAVADACTPMEARGVRVQRFFSWRMDYPRGDGTFGALPFQRLAQSVGFAAHGPAHLSVHPMVGPWFALRALIVIDVDASALPQAAARLEPCASCATQPCRAALSTALSTPETDPERWRAWLAIREVCPVGSEFRYGAEQIRYHYTHVFRSALKP
jgi:cyanocobalamin reductase (cyanide-eliminating) / alkylcobalamin dealkylase